MKIYYIKSYHYNHVTLWKGTLEHLINHVFSYTLDCGHSWDPKVNTNPRTGNSLVTALNKSAWACHRYNDDYELSSEEEWNACTEPEVMGSKSYAK